MSFQNQNFVATEKSSTHDLQEHAIRLRFLHQESNCRLNQKRKCDKRFPCGLCESKLIKCTYSHQKDLELQLMNVEKRIKELQQNLLKPNNQIYQRREKILPIIKHITLSKDLEIELFERNHDHLLQLRFSKYPCVVYGVKESYYRQSAKIFWPLRFALYSSGALFIKDDQVPIGVANRLELVNIYLHKAQSYNFIENCTPLTILTLQTICNACYQLNLTQEAILYFRFALQQARICKINSEEGIERLSVFDYERENIRRTWWVLFRDYSNFSKLLGPDTINHQENQIFLPTSNFGFEPNTAEAYYGIEVMSSNSWYIPTPAGLEVDGYYMLILKIQAKMFHYFEIELSSAVQQFYYCAGAISASLNDWHSSFNSHFENANLKILGKINYQQEINWYTMYAALIYCSVRINLFLPSFMRNVIKEKNIRNQFYFQETVQAARLSAHIIELVMRYNPLLEYFPGAALLNLFPCGFFLLCCCKLNIENINHSYQLMQNGIKHTCNAFQKLDKFYQVLNLLEDKPLLDCVLYYGIFISRQTQELMERPASEYIDLFAELKIKSS